MSGAHLCDTKAVARTGLTDLPQNCCTRDPYLSEVTCSVMYRVKLIEEVTHLHQEQQTPFITSHYMVKNINMAFFLAIT